MVWFRLRSRRISSSSWTQLFIDAHADESLPAQLIEELAKFAFPATHDGRKNHDARIPVFSGGFSSRAMIDETICSVVCREMRRPH